jgi:hypothetical protein
MKTFKQIWVVGLSVTLLIIAIPIIIWIPNEPVKADDPWASVPVRVPATDHSDLITGPLETGPEVTAVCLDCHEDASHQMMQTVHWTWESEPVMLPGRDEPVTIGKANQINNYCIGIRGNEPACNTCHAGYGWEDSTFDFTNELLVDCLACHADRGCTAKAPPGDRLKG